MRVQQNDIMALERRKEGALAGSRLVAKRVVVAKRLSRDAQPSAAPGPPRVRRSGGRRKKDDRLDQIGGHLRKLYRDVLAEPVPDELLRVLDEMGEKERRKG